MRAFTTPRMPASSSASASGFMERAMRSAADSWSAS